MPHLNCKYNKCIYESDLQMVEGEIAWLMDSEFLGKYRTSWEGLDFLTMLLQDASVFTKPNCGLNELPMKY